MSHCDDLHRRGGLQFGPVTVMTVAASRDDVTGPPAFCEYLPPPPLLVVVLGAVASLTAP
jgi:hypothetical protein